MMEHFVFACTSEQPVWIYVVSGTAQWCKDYVQRDFSKLYPKATYMVICGSKVDLLEGL